MDPTNIKPGTKLTLGLYSRKDDDQSFSLSSTFEMDEEGGNFVIAAPLFSGNFYPVALDELLFISFSDSKARYDMQGTVIDRFRIENLAYLRVKRLTEIVKTQRRDDFRIEVVLDVELERVLRENDKVVTKRVKARTIDLSGGGTAVWCDDYVPEGEKLMVGLPIGEKSGYTFFNSEVRWVRRTDREEVAYKYFLGFRFLHKNNMEKEKLVKYIFSLQRKRMTTSTTTKKTAANPFDDLI